MSMPNLDLDQIIKVRKALGISSKTILYENDFLKVYYCDLDGYIYIIDKKNNRKCYKHIKDLAYDTITEWEKDCKEFIEE